MGNELVQVPFHGDVIEAAQDGNGDVWVPLKRPCESVGVAPNGQIEKLKAKAWAVGKMILSTASDGKSYEMYALRLDCLPMWLATIDASRVKKELRAKLELYQKEAAHVLADHFLPCRPKQPGSVSPDWLDALRAEVCDLVVSEVRGCLAAARPSLPEPQYTIKDRMEAMGWRSASPRQRDQVRNLALVKVQRAGFPRPSPEAPSPGAQLLFPAHQLHLLDDAIMMIWDEAKHAESGGMFA